MDFGRYAEEHAKRQGKKPATFDFLGFTHICARSRRGKFAVNMRTMKKRLGRGLTAVAEWCQEHRHEPVDKQQKALNAMLRGHYQYYGRPTNSRSLWQFYRAVCNIWRKWLSRRTRGQEKYTELLRRHPLLLPWITHSWKMRGESRLRNPLRGNLHGGVCEGGERRFCHGRPKRARSWKRRTQPRKTYSTPGSPLLGEMSGKAAPQELRSEKARIYTPDSSCLVPRGNYARVLGGPERGLTLQWEEMEFTTRLCGPGDEKALSLVAQATILETYAGITDGADLLTYVTAESSMADFSRVVASDRRRAWIAETVAGKCAIGYAVAVSDEDAKSFSSFELKRLYIFYRFHGHGLGKRLMEDVLLFAKQMKSERIWLEVHEANSHAIEFYKRFGFVQTGVDLFRAGKGSYRVLNMGLTLAH